MDLGKLLRELREKRGLSQEDLAKAVGTTGANLSRIELSEQQPRAALLTKLADYFGVSADYLLGRAVHSEDLPADLRELFELAVNAGYAADLKDFFRWLAAKRNRLLGEKDKIPRQPDEGLLAFVSDLTEGEIKTMLSKFEGDVVQRIAKLTPDQKKVFNEEVAKILYYLELEKKVKTSGEAAEARTKRG
jgi:transcriptional regulator with XRE-family HTH domain